MNTIKKALREGLPCDNKGYLNSYKANIYEGKMLEEFYNMFDNGSGKEMHSKARAVHSSSMLGYNFFHWVKRNHPITINGTKYSQVYFEVKMRVLKGTTPANMDVLLIGKKSSRTQLLFIESKFLEYLQSERYNLSDSYRKTDKWYSHEDRDWNSFLDDVKDCVDETSCSYKGGIKQGVSHLFALSNLANKRAFNSFVSVNNLQIPLKGKSYEDVDIHFLNVIFEPSSSLFANEHKLFMDYRDLYNQLIDLSEKYDLIKPEFMTYSKLWQESGNQIKIVDQGHLYQYLDERYMRFAEM